MAAAPDALTRREALEAYAAETSACTRCRLAQGRTQVVFGVGHPDADLMFVGEAPGFHEDKQGYPFVGSAGKLLDKLLEGIGLSRSQVYIANVIKCRPPGNRDPMPDEIEACEAHLFRQIELIEPKLIATLGNFATKLLSGKSYGITRVHGRPQEATLGGRRVTLFPIYHPAAALYTRPARRRGPRASPSCRNRAAVPGPRGGCRRSARSSAVRRRAARPLLELPGGEGVTELASSSPEDTERIARAVAHELEQGDVVTVAGELGSGKTTFVRGAARALGITAPITSPTYTIGHRYRGAPDVSHLDLYRFESMSDGEWGDLERYFDDAVVFVEWPDVAEGFLPAPRARVLLRHLGENTRLIELDSSEKDLEIRIADRACARL